MPNKTRFIVLVTVAALAGLVAEVIINAIMGTPEIVDWCIEGSVGYIAAELAELVIEYAGKVRSNGKPQ